MRRILRLTLSKSATAYLAKKQADTNQGKNVDRLWKYARRTKAIADVLDVLVKMSRSRQRCMYCEDSRGTTVEHFWPKSRYPEKAFVWFNLLLLCQGCQNRKGDRFDLDVSGQPMLINPTAEDPWDFLFFDSMTGIITARFDPVTGSENLRGAHTTNKNSLPLNIEAVTEGRLRATRNLKRAILAFFSGVTTGDDRESLQQELMAAIHDNSDYGLDRWFFRLDGCVESPFSRLQAEHPDVWNRISKSVDKNSHG